MMRGILFTAMVSVILCPICSFAERTNRVEAAEAARMVVKVPIQHGWHVEPMSVSVPKVPKALQSEKIHVAVGAIFEAASAESSEVEVAKVFSAMKASLEQFEVVEAVRQSLADFPTDNIPVILSALFATFEQQVVSNVLVQALLSVPDSSIEPVLTSMLAHASTGETVKVLASVFATAPQVRADKVISALMAGDDITRLSYGTNRDAVNLLVKGLKNAMETGDDKAYNRLLSELAALLSSK